MIIQFSIFFVAIILLLSFFLVGKIFRILSFVSVLTLVLGFFLIVLGLFSPNWIFNYLAEPVVQNQFVVQSIDFANSTSEIIDKSKNTITNIFNKSDTTEDEQESLNTYIRNFVANTIRSISILLGLIFMSISVVIKFVVHKEELIAELEHKISVLEKSQNL